jgi:hypothetical protein
MVWPLPDDFPGIDERTTGSGLSGIKGGFAMTDMVGSRTLRSQWDETVRCYGRVPFWNISPWTTR